MTRLIQVECIDGTTCRMAPRALDMFIARHRVKRFRRSAGWAVLGVDPVRGMGDPRSYHGPERRAA